MVRTTHEHCDGRDCIIHGYSYPVISCSYPSLCNIANQARHATTAWPPLTHLVHIVVIYGGIEHGVEVIEQLDHLHGGGHGRDGREAHDVREVDGHLLEGLSLHGLAHQEALRYRPETGGEGGVISLSMAVYWTLHIY